MEKTEPQCIVRKVNDRGREMESLEDPDDVISLCILSALHNARYRTGCLIQVC